MIVTLSLFFSTFSFAQTENIIGAEFQDGSIIYGRVIKINVYDIHIETKDGKILSRKFDDVVRFLKDPDVNANGREKSQGKKENLSIAIGTERMSGNTTYQIGYPITDPGGIQYAGYFPFSKLEWPLDIWLARLDAGLTIGNAWRINGVLKKNLSDHNDIMEDSDWITSADPGRLDVYSNSDISKFDAWIFDIDVEWLFLKQKPFTLYAGLGYQHQKFDYDAKLIHQYSPSGLAGAEAYGDGSVGITYGITYSMPYLKIGTDFQVNDKFTLAGSFAWSPMVKAKDEDHHLLRANGGIIATGKMDGNAYMINVSTKYNFTPSWFLQGGFHYTRIDVDGEQRNVYGNGAPLDTTAETSESTQTSGYLTVGYTF
jgi:outer membrane protease